MIEGLTTFYIILSIYLISVIGIFVLCRYAYVAVGWEKKDRIAPTFWIIPVINTIMMLVIFVKVWRYFPITSDMYWTKKWTKARKKHVERVKKGEVLDCTVPEELQHVYEDNVLHGPVELSPNGEPID